MTAEEAIGTLKAKIERLGPVNMMAIEQFDELEARHTFLATQRKDLVDSIDQTTNAIKRIDETSTVRFNEAFLSSSISSRLSAPCSAEVVPVSRCSTRTIRSRAASTSSPHPQASGYRMCSCFRAARRRSRRLR